MTSLSWQSLFNYVVRVGDAFSQLLNVTFLFGDNPNESISGRAYRLNKLSIPWHVAYLVINFIFFLQNDHCFRAYQADLDRARRMLENERSD